MICEICNSNDIKYKSPNMFNKNLCQKCYLHEYRKTHIDKKHVGRQSKHYNKVKKNMMIAIGGQAKCKYCGCDYLPFLEFNHINGGGNIWFKTNKMSILYGLKTGVINKNDIEITCKLCNNLQYLKSQKNFRKALKFTITWESIPKV